MSVSQSDRELAIDSDLPIIDAHHHLWSIPPAPGFPVYDEDRVLDDKVNSGHNVVATIYVEAQSHYRDSEPEHLRVVGETDYINRFADAANAQGGSAAGACAGIIAHADLLLGASVAEVLAAHRDAAPQRFVGIRHRTSYDPDVPMHSGSPPGESLRPEFREGMAQLAPAGLSFDAAFFQSQLGELFELAAAFPDTRIVINHAGYPIGVGRYRDSPEEAFGDWRAKLHQLAGLENVFVKIGGLNMDFTGLAVSGDSSATIDQVVNLQCRHVRTVIELFGPKRCMFESNFPVDMPCISYSVLWDAFKVMTRDLSDDERGELFAGTARSVYGL